MSDDKVTCPINDIDTSLPLSKQQKYMQRFNSYSSGVTKAPDLRHVPQGTSPKGARQGRQDEQEIKGVLRTYELDQQTDKEEEDQCEGEEESYCGDCEETQTSQGQKQRNKPRNKITRRRPLLPTPISGKTIDRRGRRIFTDRDQTSFPRDRQFYTKQHRQLLSKIRNSRTGKGTKRQIQQLKRLKQQIKTYRSNKQLGKKTSQKKRNDPLLQFTSILKKNSSRNTISRNVSYRTPMPRLKPTERKTRNGVRVVGSEFLTSISVYTSQSGTFEPTQPGYIIAWVPLNPKLITGTRLATYVSLYQHYRYNHITFEYIPAVPSIQDGSIGMAVTYDPIENWSNLATNPDVLMRIFMSHEGSNISNVYSYGRAFLVRQPDTLKEYFVEEGEDARLEMQGNFVIVAASGFTPYDGAMEQVTLGNIIMHYDCTMTERDVDDELAEPVKYVGVSVTNQFQTLFTSATINAQVFFAAAYFGANFSGRIDGFYMLRLLSPLIDSTTATAVTFNGEIQGTVYPVAGAVFFLYCKTVGGNAYFCQNEDDAMNKNDTSVLLWGVTRPNTNQASLGFDLTFFAYDEQ